MESALINNLLKLTTYINDDTEKQNINSLLNELIYFQKIINAQILKNLGNSTEIDSFDSKDFKVALESIL
ncbi:hypothetical protein [Alphaentomopoxvirus acuprea]|uniref:Uncharacterized protein n=1 Tax=Alphaentomopoxvirus acuprea TaxID=62099 RepID=W6JL33_9POXV|nr:hypothetical protein BA82_gp185 [Anomala cuprea entomopoxvirus]BAO49545.1 hypothetical protein [Anomala cuprea entomopoxvirus]